MNEWSENLGVEYPECNMCAQCCICASPSSSYIDLLEKAAKGDTFAQDFFTIFQPYESLEEARKVCPETIKRSIETCEQTNSKVKVEDLVFYHCKYVSDDNKCLIHEDRPQLCRDYPDLPYLVLPKGCAYENWAKECKIKHKELKDNLEQLKQQHQELNNMQIQQNAIQKLKLLQKVDPKYKFMVLLPQMSLLSPYKSWIK